MSERSDKSSEIAKKAAEQYSENTALRAAVQLIPYVGGPLDTLIGGEGQKIQQRRVANLLSELDTRLRKIESPVEVSIDEEELLDLMVGTFEKAAKTRSKEKHARFAQIIAHDIEFSKSTEDAEIALRLIAELDDLHIQILSAAIQAPMCSAPFEGLRVVTISERQQLPFLMGSNSFSALTNQFKSIPEPVLSLACSELVSRGLLHDEGIGRYNLKAMEFFVATDLATWLFDWLSD